MIKAGIIGGAGYTAGELIRILVNHPEVELTFVHSESNAGNKLHDVHQGLYGDTEISFSSTFDLGSVDVLFMCSGHGRSEAFWKEHERPGGLKVIDLAQDFRDEHDGYVYGLPEWRRDSIRNASLIANPGCFATAIQLALLPLANAGLLTDEIQVTAITGSTGAGVKPGATTHFSWRNSNVSTYKVFGHQHLIEIRRNLGLAAALSADAVASADASLRSATPQAVSPLALPREARSAGAVASSDASLRSATPQAVSPLALPREARSAGAVASSDASLRSAPPQAVPPLTLPRVARSAEATAPADEYGSLLPDINFVPVRGDFARGIFASVYTDCRLDAEEAVKLYKDYYNDARFTFVSDKAVDLKDVVNTNKALVHVEKHGSKIVVSSVIDNLLKGASGQAVQNMNLIFGLPEDMGLKLKASAF